MSPGCDVRCESECESGRGYALSPPGGHFCQKIAVTFFFMRGARRTRARASEARAVTSREVWELGPRAVKRRTQKGSESEYRIVLSVVQTPESRPVPSGFCILVYITHNG